MKRAIDPAKSLRGDDIPSGDITPQALFEARRHVLRAAAAGAFGATLSTWFGRPAFAQTPSPNPGAIKLTAKSNPQYTVADKLTSYQDVTTYNNYYEFGTDKADPAQQAGSLVTRPWQVSVEGLVKKPRTFELDDLLKLASMEDRVYRLRCVEGWSMVIPWVGYPLAELIKRVEPLGSAKYVEFVTLADERQMPGIRRAVLDWPYVEGLRLDEAMNPLTLLTFGVYGEVLPKQNGAPVRIVVPWKYGFKSAKSIVKIRFVEQMPQTSWNKAGSNEYGFYSNVNPQVNHPRWSQATERRIGDGGNFLGGLLAPKRKTLLFNGYEQQVASMYAGMDLRTFF